NVALRAQVCPAFPDICISTDPATGNASIRLEAASYTLQTSAARHITDTRTITIVAGQTLNANIALDSAHVLYTPTPVVMSMAANNIQTTTLRLNNTGAGNLQFHLQEALGPAPAGCNYTAPAPPGQYIIDKQWTVPATGQHGEQATGSD